MGRVELYEEKCIYNLNGMEIQILWSEISKIYYYKYDCITHKKGCLAINYENGEFVEVFEDMNGWSELVNNLDNYLQLKEKEWYEGLKKAKPNDEAVEIYVKGN